MSFTRESKKCLEGNVKFGPTHLNLTGSGLCPMAALQLLRHRNLYQRWIVRTGIEQEVPNASPEPDRDLRCAAAARRMRLAPTRVKILF